MKTTIQRMMAAVMTASILLAGGAWAGNLTPPGAPGSTMKTLDEIHTAVENVKSRIDLATVAGSTTAHYYITEPGSYFLSGNIDVSKTYGILVNSDDVTIDLNGFVISRETSGTKYGIYLKGGISRTTIRNGKIQGLTHGISYESTPSVPKGSLFEGIMVSECSSSGIKASNGTRLINCQANNNLSIGISSEYAVVLEGCSAFYNEGLRAITVGPGSVLNDCAIFNNLVTYANLYVGDGSILNNCTVYENGMCTYGIYAGDSTVITKCSVTKNECNYGIYSGDDSVLSHCVVTENSGAATESYGIRGGFRTCIFGCTVASQTSLLSPGSKELGTGIYIMSGGIVRDCIVSLNAGDGIRAYSECLIINNNCQNNGENGDGAGIHVRFDDCRVEGNNCNGNDRGIDVDIAGNFIAKNSCSGNSVNWDIASGNVCLVVSATTSGPISGNNGGVSPGSTDPNANFTY